MKKLENLTGFPYHETNSEVLKINKAIYPLSYRRKGKNQLYGVNRYKRKVNSFDAYDGLLREIHEIT